MNDSFYYKFILSLATSKSSVQRRSVHAEHVAADPIVQYRSSSSGLERYTCMMSFVIEG
jgi:hypothetical protein